MNLHSKAYYFPFSNFCLKILLFDKKSKKIGPSNEKSDFFSDNSMFAIIVNFGYQLGQNQLRDTTLVRSLRVFPGRVNCSDFGGNPEVISLRTKQCCCCLPTFAPCCLMQWLYRLHCYCYHWILVSLACTQDQWLSRVPLDLQCQIVIFEASTIVDWVDTGSQPFLHYSAHTM